MARLPRRTHNPGTGMPSLNTHRKPVGYGLHGTPFYNQKKYNASKSGNLHAQHPGLSVKPVGYGAKGKAFFSKAKFLASKAGRPTRRIEATALKGVSRRRQRPR